MREEVLREEDLNEYKGYKIGDRVSFLKPKDWLIERIVRRITETSGKDEDGQPYSSKVKEIFFVTGEGSGWANPIHFREISGSFYYY